MCTPDLNCRKVKQTLETDAWFRICPKSDDSRKAQVSFIEGDEMHER